MSVPQWRMVESLAAAERDVVVMIAVAMSALWRVAWSCICGILCLGVERKDTTDAERVQRTRKNDAATPITTKIEEE